MNKGIFITGTDTGVGKTYVAAGLIRAAKGKGLSVCPMKPVETGCGVRNGKLVPEDAVRLMKAADVDEPVDFINPYRLKKPLAPSVASEIEGISIDRKRIIASYSRMKRKYGLTVVEGAGGIMVPLAGQYLVLDMIRDLNIPLVIVARPGIGTINHSLLTVAAARSRKLNVLGVIINYAVQKRTGLSEKTNPAVIEQLGAVPVLGTVPHLKDGSGAVGKEIFSGIMENILSRL